MWKVIYIAQTPKIAETIQTRLSQEGFLIKLRALSPASQQFEVLVPSVELEEVQEVLTGILHSHHR